MRSPIFDTLAYMQDLRSGGMTQEEAEAFTKATEKALHQALEEKQIATQDDLKNSETLLKNDIHFTEERLIRHINDTKIELTKYINDTKSELMKFISESSWKTVGIILTFQTIIFGISTFLHRGV